jgi:23S rRNA (pseudouridine1915-N3)-methyltransferase
MKITIAAVGKLKEAYWAAAQDEYLKRLRPYATVNVVEVKDEAGLVAAIPAGAREIALDERGQTLSSMEFAAELAVDPAPLVFAVGGPDGHTDVVRARAKLVSFGRMTIAHRLVRIVLLEQIYRGFRILRGEPYHRE